MRSVAQIRKLQAERAEKDRLRLKKEKNDRKLKGLNTSALYPDADSSSEEAPLSEAEKRKIKRDRRRDTLAARYHKRVESWLLDKKAEVESTGNQDAINIHIAPRDHDFRPRDKKKEVGPEWKSNPRGQGYIPEKERIAQTVSTTKLMKQSKYTGGHVSNLARERDPSKEIGGPFRFGRLPTSDQERVDAAMAENQLVFTEPVTMKTQAIGAGAPGQSRSGSVKAPVYRPVTPSQWMGDRDFCRHIGKRSNAEREQTKNLYGVNSGSSWIDPHKIAEGFRSRAKDKEVGGEFYSNGSRPTSAASKGRRPASALGTTQQRRPVSAMGRMRTRSDNIDSDLIDDYNENEQPARPQRGTVQFDLETTRKRPSTATSNRHSYYNSIATIAATGNMSRKHRPLSANAHGEYSSRRAKVKDALKVARSRPTTHEWM